MPQATPTLAQPREGDEQESGAHERHLATGSLAHQVALVVGAFTMLGTITALGRTLTLTEFGVYGLVLSIPTYLILTQGSVETVAVKAIAQAHDQLDRDRAFTTALSMYLVFGLIEALLIAFGGSALLDLFTVPARMHDQAHLALLSLAAVNVVGWPAKTAHDALRGTGRFVAAAAAEALGAMTCGALVVLALALAAPLWIVVGLSGALSLLIALWAIVWALLTQTPMRVRLWTLSFDYARPLLSMSLFLMGTSIIDLPVYSLDRAILGANRPVAAVGLYEAIVRAHNLLRQVQAALVLTVMPSAAAYLAVGDNARLRELLIRGTRYVTIVMMPLTVTFMALAAPILTVWLGPRYAVAAGAMTIFVSYWLVLGGSSVGLSMIIVAGQLRKVLFYGVAVATLNLTTSLLLTPRLGLDGIVIGTSLSYVIMAPLFMFVVCRAFDVPVMQYLREGFALTLSAGTLLAVFQLLARAALPIERAAVLLPVILISLAGYAAGLYSLGLKRSERLLVRTTLATGFRRLRSLRGEAATMWATNSARLATRHGRG